MSLFHSGMNHWQRLQDDLRVIDVSCRNAGVIPDRSKIGATFLLRTLFHARKNGRQSFSHVANILRQFTSLSWFWLFRLVARRLRYGTPWLINEKHLTAANNHS